MIKAVDFTGVSFVLAQISRHAMDIDTWRATLVGVLHPALGKEVQLNEGEACLVSYLDTDGAWYVITNWRIVFSAQGTSNSVQLEEIKDERFGIFKGSEDSSTEQMKLLLESGQELSIQYETGKASMAPIYAFRALRDKRVRMQ